MMEPDDTTPDTPPDASDANDESPAGEPTDAPADATASPTSSESAEAPAAREPREKRVRAFIAVNLPVATVRRIADEVAAMKRPIADAGVRVAWVPPANVHLTLKFLGYVREEALDAIRAALAHGLSRHAPFEVEARGMGAFPSASHPRVLWAGTREQPALLALQQNVETWMEALGFPREERAFHPHLTIGRVKEGGGGHGAVEAALATRDTMVFGGGRVTEVVLYESRQQAKGSEYTARARVPIGV